MKWEYKSFARTFPAEKINQVEWFNELGEDGWEVVEVKSAFDRDYTTCHFFVLAKRVKQ